MVGDRPRDIAARIGVGVETVPARHAARLAGNGAGADIGGQRAHRNAKAGKIGEHQTRGERSPGYLPAAQPQTVPGALAVPRDDERPAMIVVRDNGPETGWKRVREGKRVSKS